MVEDKAIKFTEYMNKVEQETVNLGIKLTKEDKKFYQKLFIGLNALNKLKKNNLSINTGLNYETLYHMIGRK